MKWKLPRNYNKKSKKIRRLEWPNNKEVGLLFLNTHTHTHNIKPSSDSFTGM